MIVLWLFAIGLLAFGLAGWALGLFITGIVVGVCEIRAGGRRVRSR